VAPAKKLFVPAVIRNEIASLKRRVTWLEREFSRGVPERPAIPQTTLDKAIADDSARAKAEREYWQAKRDAQLLADPAAMARARQAEREFNEFLKARGIKPLPSRLPRLVRPQRPKPSKRSARNGKRTVG
jgi:hypothetical protein